MSPSRLSFPKQLRDALTDVFDVGLIDTGKEPVNRIV